MRQEKVYDVINKTIHQMLNRFSKIVLQFKFIKKNAFFKTLNIQRKTFKIIYN